MIPLGFFKLKAILALEEEKEGEEQESLQEPKSMSEEVVVAAAMKTDSLFSQVYLKKKHF